MKPLTALGVLLREIFIPRATVALVNLALRKQLAVLRRQTKRPRMRQSDRVFCVLLKRLWPDWRLGPGRSSGRKRSSAGTDRDSDCSGVGSRVPKAGGQKSNARLARPDPPHESRESHLGRLRGIQSELKLLGYDLAESTVAKYMFHTSKPPCANLEDVSGQSHRRTDGHRLLHSPDRHVSRVVRVRGAQPRSPPRAALQRDRQSVRLMDGTASARGLSLRFRSTLPASARPRREHLRRRFPSKDQKPGHRRSA